MTDAYRKVVIATEAELLASIAACRKLIVENDGEGDVSPQDMLEKLYLPLNYDDKPPTELYECGSARMKDTPKALYRLLYLFKPQRVSFGAMYKARLLMLKDPTGEMLASFEFYKYEVAVYFGAKRRHVAGKGSGVVCGLPGFDNGVRCETEVSREWFRLLVDALNREWMVYGGNDFEV